MEEDIKILEEFAHDLMQDYIYSKDEIPKSDIRLKDAIQNLIQRFYVVKSEYKREEYRNELLEEEIREYRNNFIPKSKINNEINYLKQKYDLEEDYINYEKVVEILQELLEE